MKSMHFKNHEKARVHGVGQDSLRAVRLLPAEVCAVPGHQLGLVLHIFQHQRRHFKEWRRLRRQGEADQVSPVGIE